MEWGSSMHLKPSASVLTTTGSLCIQKESGSFQGSFYSTLSQISEIGQMKHVIKVALLVLSTQKAMDSRDRYITALIKLPFQYISQLSRPLITAFSRLLKFVGKQNILCRDKDKKSWVNSSDRIDWIKRETSSSVLVTWDSLYSHFTVTGTLWHPSRLKPTPKKIR